MIQYIKILFIFAGVLVVNSLSAQVPPPPPADKMAAQNPDKRDRLRERIRAQHAAFITQRLELTEGEAVLFWPIFNEFEAKMQAARKAAKPSMEIEKMTDAEAEKAMNTDLDRQIREIELKREYIQKLKKAVSVHKIAKLHRAERDFKLMIAKKVQQKRDKKGDDNRRFPRRPPPPPRD
ncbi:MAG: hypothetical protein RL757_2957 [Bacteroidota bacterium]|jgi:hypothetical protein